ncbi:deoxyribodipyrimidine photolyase [Nocardioides sp. Root122]|uniref:cryptochrome/photolyase family protein n=1 Tax=Nocardioides TaxID=1839 RepID=UPI0007037A02|nr:MULTISPECIES: cryptochrome/photolyase family protein [Nocardioides]KQV77931.1 deoxyribodipyrimidine photolyase [Nocardioides sp. Root122]MCK9822418.1 cryptochrome/photolyase family protein [Nocardioides cavernae]
MTTRWLFGDQLGPHFTDDHPGPLLMVESLGVLKRRRFHRAKAHLVLSAMRHRAAELGDRVTYVRAETYAEVARDALRSGGDLEVVHPTSYAALGLVERLGATVLPPRGFATGATTLGVTEPWWPEEDEIDAGVRDDLDRWERDGVVETIGRDGPRRFPVTRREALAALDHFVEHRLPDFGAHEDAILEGDPWMAHSLVSAPLNLGLLDPLEVVERAEAAYRSGAAPVASVEGYVRQVIGWRDYVWHLYWHQGEGYRRANELRATERLPRWFAELDADATDARCLSWALDQVAEHGWVHHIPRLMVLGSYALQRGWAPTQVTDWFHRAFVDGYDWVMVPNVVGMSQHADGGVMATKPYTSGGAYIDRMSDHCGSCRFSPKVRVGEDACPFTAGYWWFLERHRERFEGNQRMTRAVRGLDRLTDLPGLVVQESARGNRAP